MTSRGLFQVAQAAFVVVATSLLIGPPAAHGQPATDQPTIQVEKSADERGAFWVARVPMGTLGDIREFRLDPSVVRPRVSRVSKDQKHAVIISPTNNGEMIAVVDLQTGAFSEYRVAIASLSLDGELLVYEPFQPRGQERKSSKYFVFAPGLPRGATEPGVEFYPKDAFRHSRQSAFFWVSPHIVAFVDNKGDSEVRVVAAQFDQNGRVVRSASNVLQIEEFVSPQGRAEGRNAVKAVANPQITRVKDTEPETLQLRLLFRSPELQVRRADITMW